MKGILNKKFIPFLALVLLLAVFVPQHQAKAACFSLSEGINATDCMVSILEAPIVAIGTAISWAANAFGSFIQPDVQDRAFSFSAVQQAWANIRDFVNMFFILILIIMAFGTIFDLQKYSVRNSPIFISFLIAALLINFSFVIGRYVISIGNGLSAVFLKQIGSLDIGTRLAQGLSLQKMFLYKGTDISASALNFAAIGGKILIAEGFIIVFSVIALLAFISAFLFSLIRIPFLWFLLILSPLAVIAYVLPGTRQYWEKWKKAFISWVFFLPVYVFFLMFAFIFIAQKPASQTLTANLPVSSILASLFSLDDIFFYVLTLIFLIGGLMMAMKTGSLMSDGVGWAMKGIQTGVKKYAPGAKYVRALYAGYQETRKRVREEGIPGVLEGAQAEKQRAARVSERMEAALGLRPSSAAQKEFSGRINKEYEYLKQQYDLGQIDINKIRQGAEQIKVDDPRSIAYSKMLAEVGQLDPSKTFNTLQTLKNNPFAAVDFVKTAVKSKFSAVPGNEVLKMAAAEGVYAELGTSSNYLPARREIYKYIQSDAKTASGITAQQFERGIEILGGPTTADGAAYLKDIGKIRPDLVSDYNIAHPKPGEAPKPRDQIMAGFLTNPQDIGNMSKTVWNDLDFKRVLYDRFRAGSPRTQRNFLSSLERFVLEAGRDVAEKQIVIQDMLTAAARP